MNNDPVFVRINTLLVDQGKMQKDLISYLGMARGTYSQWKSARCLSYRTHLAEIAKYFDVPVSFLIEGVNENAPVDGTKKQLFTYDLSEEERTYVECIKKMSETDFKIVKLLPELSSDEKEIIMQICEAFYDRHKKMTRR